MKRQKAEPQTWPDWENRLSDSQVDRGGNFPVGGSTMLFRRLPFFAGIAMVLCFVCLLFTAPAVATPMTSGSWTFSQYVESRALAMDSSFNMQQDPTDGGVNSDGTGGPISGTGAYEVEFRETSTVAAANSTGRASLDFGTSQTSATDVVFQLTAETMARGEITAGPPSAFSTAAEATGNATNFTWIFTLTESTDLTFTADVESVAVEADQSGFSFELLAETSPGTGNFNSLVFFTRDVSELGNTHTYENVGGYPRILTHLTQGHTNWNSH